MGPLKHQTMPSMCDWLMTVFSVHLVTDQPQIGAIGVASQGRGMDGPSRNSVNAPPASQAGRRVGPAL
jgi:hypothetical protein